MTTNSSIEKKTDKKADGKKTSLTKKTNAIIYDRTHPMWKVLTASRTKFGAQVTKNGQVKQKCIENSINKHYPDELRFWLDFKGATEKLTDSITFNTYCETRSLKPETVAQHILFEGYNLVQTVIRDGVEDVLGERIMMFKEALYDDKNNLYEKKETKDVPKKA